MFFEIGTVNYISKIGLLLRNANIELQKKQYKINNDGRYSYDEMPALQEIFGKNWEIDGSSSVHLNRLNNTSTDIHSWQHIQQM